ncbi:MAG: multi-sensor signal transduction histidine kinase [Promethearchaeota archaeon CR_4]|nr:MAG: multi-sensor signal transduction histidine kinase [Candidatus Lokiarchaeota archaeon CR_4]
MEILNDLSLLLNGLVLYAAISNLYVFKRNKKQKVNFLFSLCCFCVFAYNLLCAGLYNSSSISEGVMWQQAQFVVLQLISLTFLWFIVFLTSHKRTKIVWGFSIFYLTLCIAGFLDHWGMVWDITRPAVKVIQFLPTLGIIYYEAGAGFLYILFSVITIVGFMYLIWMTRKYYYKRHLNEAKPLFIVLCVFFVGIFNDLAVSQQLYSFIYILEFTNVGMVVLMNIILAPATATSVLVKDAIKERSTQYRILVEQMSEGFTIIDKDMRLTFVNDALCDILGYLRENLIGHAPSDFLDPANQVIFRQHVELRKKKQKSSYELEWITGAGGKVTTIISGTPLFGERGEYKGAFAVVTDISQIKQVENDLFHAKLIAEAANRAKSDFLANMSHELRTPLNSIIGFSEILIDGLAGPIVDEQKEDLDIIHNMGQHVLTIINAMLDVSKIEAGKMTLNLETFSLYDLLKTSYDIFKAEAARKTITLQLDIPEQGDCQIVADKGKVRQVIFNLLGNAIKFTPIGGSVGLKVTEQDRMYKITVWDTGPGIKRENLEKLFQPFQQLEDPYSKSFEGTGLGLYYSKRLVGLYGGNIWVENEPERGSQFHFTIPRSEAH